ncbi:hypothetical protein NC652_022452 [Populus alba x Populus x berolinensis]|nr:hypothetical protein NC652_022452 [Populus alba x Populus x berolinensis]
MARLRNVRAGSPGSSPPERRDRGKSERTSEVKSLTRIFWIWIRMVSGCFTDGKRAGILFAISCWKSAQPGN